MFVDVSSPPDDTVSQRDFYSNLGFVPVFNPPSIVSGSNGNGTDGQETGAVAAAAPTSPDEPNSSSENEIAQNGGGGGTISESLAVAAAVAAARGEVVCMTRNF